jgi:ribosomal protein L19E
MKIAINLKLKATKQVKIESFERIRVRNNLQSIQDKVEIDRHFYLSYILKIKLKSFGEY